MDRRKEKTKNAIQEAYFNLLMNGNKDKISITQIANEANIDRKTFYLHYTCVDDIIREFASDRIQELKELLVEENFSKESFSVLRFFELLNQIVERHLGIFHFISINKTYAFFFDRLKEMLINIIAETYQGYFDFSETKLRMYADFYIAGIISVYIRWISNGYPITMTELAELVSTASFGGLKGLMEGQVAR